MKLKKSNFLWLNPFYEVSIPLHKLFLSIILTLIIACLLATLLIASINLGVELELLLANTPYFYPVIIGEAFLAATGLLFAVHILSLGRKKYYVGNFFTNIKIWFQKPSYVHFLWAGIILSPLMTIFIQILHTLDVVVKFPHAIDMSMLFGLSGALLLLFLIGGYRRLSSDPLRFAPGTTNDDELGYQGAAIKDMQRIISSDEHILIANINGRLGEGKSSYLRMMIESQDQNDFLYTFISLTETNETKSFSKLFSERWADTISSRYPSIISSAKNSIIDHIFRESISGTLKIVYSAMNIARWPVYRTAIKANGDNHPTIQYAPSTIASLFAYVPRFNEKYWVIVIDEIERARFDEIYRTVETIERFRIESQWGLPIRLIFILCTDRMKFRERVESDTASNEAAKLAYSFFEKEPKTIDMHIDLPPVAPDKKQNFIIKREKAWLIDRYNINVDAISNPDSKAPGDLSLYWIRDSITLSDFERGRLDDKKAHDLTLQYLLDESPRFIKKVLEETERFYAIFTKSGRSSDQIRLSDLIMLHYLKFKHPEVLGFLYKIHPEVFPDFYAGSDSRSAYQLMRYFTRKKYDNDLTLQAYYEQKMGYPLKDPRTIEGILRFICYPIFEHLLALKTEDKSVLYEDAGKSNYDRTLGLPENMWDALTIATDKVQDTSAYLRTQRDEIYTHEHQKLPTRLIKSGSRLLAFARNMRRFYPGDTVVSRFLAIRTARVISKKRLIRRFPGSLGSDTPYQNTLYSFSFHLANYISKEDVSPEYVDEAYELLSEVLTSDETMLEGKLIIIHSLFVYSQQNKSGSYELNRAREVLESKYEIEIKKLITDVMDHGLDMYLPSSNKCIYDYEENYMYTLYQMWSGKADDHKGIQKIREAAAYGLAEHPEVIGQYWQNRFARADNFVENPELQVEIETLIDATKKANLEKQYQDYIDHWTNELNKKKAAIVPVNPDSDFSTIRKNLSERGYLIRYEG